MATLNPFDLLGDDDTEDPSLLVAKVPVAKKAQAAAPAQPPAAAKLPSKPLPPAQAVRESRGEGGREGGRGGRGNRGRGRGRGYDRENVNSDNSYGSYGNKDISGGQGGGPEDAEAGKFPERRGGYGGPRGSFRGGGGGGRRGDFSNGEMGEERPPRRVFERRSGTGRGNDFKRDGAGQGNWGTATDELAETTEVVTEGEKYPNAEKSLSNEEDTADGKKEASGNEPEEKEPEDKEMTLEEYEKVLEEKRKALLALKAEERKVDAKPFETMQPLANKKENQDVFVKLRSDKDKKKDLSEKEEKTKKSLSINEFLKPADGEKYNPGGRGRGRGRGPRGGFNGGGNPSYGRAEAPSIEDQGQFPTLGAK